MDILVPDSWLREFLKTRATTREIAKYLSLCGPSVEKVSYIEKEAVYSIEVTTNRVDNASVYGIAKEASAILPRFGIKAKLIRPTSIDKTRLKGKVNYLNASVDKDLCKHFTAVLVKNVKIASSPAWMQEKLKLVGVRPINNVVDISNFVMYEISQPVHTFDYDKIKKHKMILRKSKKGEKITTLDGKTHTLMGGDIVIEDGSHRLIDLAGIIGGENSAVDENTKNVLLFVQTYNPVNIRKTSMSLAHRTDAAVLFEKGLDTELVSLGIKRGIDLFTKLKAGKPVTQILDIYPYPYKPKKLEVSLGFINKRLGIALEKSEISRILSSLGFSVSTSKDKVVIEVPSYRANDINIPEDIVEEVARIYGYHNLPSELLCGKIPDPLYNAPFEFEREIKTQLAGWGGVEVYTQSLVSQDMVQTSTALKLKNPLGKDGEYLRTSLMPSLVNAADSNKHASDAFHLFEVANIYIPQRNTLPKETMILAGIFANTNYREAKGVSEALLEKINIKVNFVQEEEKGFLPSKHIYLRENSRNIGHFGVLENGYLFYEFEVESLRKSVSTKSFIPIPKFPPQIEDLTFKLPEKTKVGEIMETILSIKLIEKVELRDIFKDSYTFTIWYRHPDKTLNNQEVEKVRDHLINLVNRIFGGIFKE